MKFYVTTIILTILSINLNAQIIKPDTTRQHFINLNFGYDYNLISLNLGYAYYVPKFKTAAFADFTQGTALLGTGNFRTQIGLQTWQGSIKKFNLKTTLAFVYSRSVNKAGSYDGLGMNFNLNAGITLKRFGIGADFQYNQFFATHIKHSSYWRQYYFPNAKDGWYNLTSNNIRVGGYLSGQLDTQKTWELNLRGGYQTSGQFDKLIPGFYFIFGLNKKI
jgi:hypothetical protein